jgi:hypothetical protein
MPCYASHEVDPRLVASSTISSPTAVNCITVTGSSRPLKHAGTPFLVISLTVGFGEETDNNDWRDT